MSGMILKDGTGTGKTAGVTKEGQVMAFSTSHTTSEQGTIDGLAVNINTGLIGVTQDTALCYIKNNEENDFIVSSFVIGLNDAGTHTATPVLSLYKNSTTGTLISTATAVDMKENKNFGSSEAFDDILAYKGADGATRTDGTETALFLVKADSRTAVGLNWVLPKGSSIVFDLDVTMSGTTQAYVAVIGHLNNQGKNQ